MTAFVDPRIPQVTAGLTGIVSGTLTPPNSGAYAVGDIISQGNAGASSGVIVAVARNIDKTGMIRRLRLKINDNNWLNQTIRVHVHRDAPVFTNGDNAAWTAGVSESAWLGSFDVTFNKQFSDCVKGIAVPNEGSELNFDPAPGTQNVYLTFEARSAVAIASTKVLTAVLEVLQN